MPCIKLINMKNLLFVTSLGLAVFFTNTAFGQDVKTGDTTKQEKKYNPKSNSKHNPNRTFGKERAADVQTKNGDAEKIAKNKGVKKVDDLAKKDKAADKELKKQKKA